MSRLTSSTAAIADGIEFELAHGKALGEDEVRAT